MPPAPSRPLAALLAASLFVTPAAARAEDLPPPTPAAAPRPPLPDPPPQPPRAFPDPKLVQKMKANRAGGAIFTLSGIGCVLAGLNLGVASARDPETFDSVGFSALTGGLMLYGIAGIAVGAPMWAVGAEMRIQLGRMNVGDELIPRVAANDPKYWSARTQSHFGSSLAVGGAGQLLLGGLSLALVGASISAGNFDTPEGEEALAEQGISDARILLLGPAVQLGTGIGMLAGGLTLWTKGRSRAVRIRDASRAAALVPVPGYDTRRQAVTLTWGAEF